VRIAMMRFRIFSIRWKKRFIFKRRILCVAITISISYIVSIYTPVSGLLRRLNPIKRGKNTDKLYTYNIYGLTRVWSREGGIFPVGLSAWHPSESPIGGGSKKYTIIIIIINEYININIVYSRDDDNSLI